MKEILFPLEKHNCKTCRYSDKKLVVTATTSDTLSAENKLYCIGVKEPFEVKEDHQCDNWKSRYLYTASKLDFDEDNGKPLIVLIYSEKQPKNKVNKDLTCLMDQVRKAYPGTGVVAIPDFIEIDKSRLDQIINFRDRLSKIIEDLSKFS